MRERTLLAAVVALLVFVLFVGHVDLVFLIGGVAAFFVMAIITRWFGVQDGPRAPWDSDES